MIESYHFSLLIVGTTFSIKTLTPFGLVHYAIRIIWTSPFPMLGVPGVFLLHDYFIWNCNSCKQTVKTLIRRGSAFQTLLMLTAADVKCM